MTPCIVKILSDQWFLNYSDPAWKEKAKEAVAQMKVYPDAARQWFIAVIDWLKEWACARTTGFGTPLPWGKGWIIETLSDSTIYMSFYTINKHIREHGIKPEALTHEVFDYIFYGKGNEAALSKASGISAEVLREMREEFLYWYPFDLRVSAKELVPNHLTFCIFHHAALFPREQWPRAIGVNGMLMIEGKQMHKSKGNFVTMKGAVERYGADAARCALLLGAEAMDDPDWRSENAADVQSKLEALLGFVDGILAKTQRAEEASLERWLLSRMQRRIDEVTAALEELKTRTALQVALFEVWNDIRWYTQRKGRADAAALNEVVKTWLRLLAPFAPHVCEELWSRTGEKGFISVARWPRVDESKVDIAAEEEENIVTDLVADTLNILRATKITPKRECYYTAASWKWQVYLKVLAKSAAGEAKINEIMKELAADPDLRPHMREAAALVPRVITTLTKVPNERKVNMLKIQAINEKAVIADAVGFLKERFNAEIEVYSEDDKECYDPKHRASFAMPYQPAIYIE
jgi:leucyl-tRNA synthetase